MVRARNLVLKPSTFVTCIFCELTFLRRWSLDYKGKLFCPECAAGLLERLCTDTKHDLEGEVFEDD